MSFSGYRLAGCYVLTAKIQIQLTINIFFSLYFYLPDTSVTLESDLIGAEEKSQMSDERKVSDC